MRLIRTYNSATGRTDVYEVLDDNWNGELPVSPDSVRLFGYVDPQSGNVAPLQKRPGQQGGAAGMYSQQSYSAPQSGMYYPGQPGGQAAPGSPGWSDGSLRQQLKQKEEKISLLQWELDDLRRQRKAEREKMADLLEQLVKKLRAS